MKGNRDSIIHSIICIVILWYLPLILKPCLFGLLAELSNVELQKSSINEHDTEHVASVRIILLIMPDVLLVIDIIHQHLPLKSSLI